MRISDWSSDVVLFRSVILKLAGRLPKPTLLSSTWMNPPPSSPCLRLPPLSATLSSSPTTSAGFRLSRSSCREASSRSEEHTSELQSLMRISYAVFCLKQKTTKPAQQHEEMNTYY